MWKSKLIFRFILSAAAIATSVELSLRSDYAVAQSASTNPNVELGQRNDTSEVAKFAIAGIGIGTIAGLLIYGFWHQKHRQSKLNSIAKIDRFREEFVCGSLADYYLSKSSNSPRSLTTPTEEKIPAPSTSEESLVKPSSSCQTDNLVAEPTADAAPNSLSDSYQNLIEEIVTTALKGQICSKEYIYRQLVENVSAGNGEIFERCLSDRLNSTQTDSQKYQELQRMLSVCGLVRLRINRLFSVTFSTEFAICKFIYADSTFLL
ncbi:MAG: hypothetical protein KME52_29025 [Desmonostoc geniculatum HA4340-LM1]|jgi:hypothetical protein|nr:hypothetical protein [Desmonostoc geniculatum HA4340-LM1]